MSFSLLYDIFMLVFNYLANQNQISQNSRMLLTAKSGIATKRCAEVVLAENNSLTGYKQSMLKALNGVAPLDEMLQAKRGRWRDWSCFIFLFSFYVT